jgi:hypothetical protein
MDGRWGGGWSGKDGVKVRWMELKLQLSMGLGKARRANDDGDQCCLAVRLARASLTRSLFEVRVPCSQPAAGSAITTGNMTVGTEVTPS